MVTRFVSLEVGLPATMAELEGAIAQALRVQGEPLRWAITAIDRERQIAQIDAVVTVEPGPLWEINTTWVSV